MAKSFSSTYFHLVFSTKNRRRLILPEFEIEVWRYFGGIARNIECKAIEVGGIEDHLHSLIGMPPKLAPSEVIKKLKSNSSRFVRGKFYVNSEFAWQNGFGLFSVSKSAVPDVRHYIRNQRKHHSKMSFEDEFRELLRLHDLEETPDMFE